MSNKMTQSFDEWFDEDKHPLMDCDKWSAEIGYKAGAESRQAEIDELKRRIKYLEKGFHTVISESGKIGFRETRGLCRHILKGESND